MLPGETLPGALQPARRLGPPPFPDSPVYPIAATTANSVNIFPQDRHLKTPRVHSYSVGVQRSLGRDMALEVRYVGNQNLYTWAEENWNERSVFESGFLDEFKLAQRNLAANIAAGRGNAFAYTGAPGHVAAADPPGLPERPRRRRQPGGLHVDELHQRGVRQPVQRRSTRSVTGALAAIDTAAFRANALTAGLPRNLIVMNPMVGGTFVVADENWTKYNSLQVELRRRLSQGLLVGANYTYGIKKASSLPTLAYPRIEVDLVATTATRRTCSR